MKLHRSMQEVIVNNTNNKPFNKNNSKAPNDALNKHNVNEQIRSEKLMVIDDLGQQLGLLPRAQALMKAYEKNMDLVQVGENDGVPIAKFMDYGKFLYAKKKQLADAKKHQKVILVKEIKMRPNIGDQDYKTKLNQAVQFFADGNKVKFTLQFRGREATMIDDVGPRFFSRILTDLVEKNVGQVVEEKDSRSNMLWTKIFFVKSK
ncbi:translation initiation factor IF-3 [Candidatus Dependentiae bacterium]|nr:translation initiation factor IF-3 [Candidatus Dependentiae bacterium]